MREKRQHKPAVDLLISVRPVTSAGPTLPLTEENYKLTDSIGFLIKYSAKIASARAENAFSHDGDTSFIQFISLVLIKEGIVATPGALARHIGYNSGGATRLLDHLEVRGLVTRERKSADRRSLAIEVTELGREKISALFPLHLNTWNAVLTEFTSTEYDMLIALLRKLLTALQAREPDPE